MGMIGGGEGSMIGSIHRIAANLDGQIELVCGCFSSIYSVSLKTGKSLFLSENRIYETWKQMIDEEAKLPKEVRMDFVAIVTPNYLHFDPAVYSLENGFHVMMDKPLTISLEQARQLKAKVQQTGLLFGLTHTYTGYPMIKEARVRVRRGDLGTLRRIYVEYPQGWLASANIKSKQAEWRLDPSKSGKTGAMADIGTHAFNLVEYITGLKAVELCAELNSFGEGRKLDDDGVVLIRYEGGVKAMLAASQIAAGEGNDFFIRIYGEKGGLEWHQELPNTLILKSNDQPKQLLGPSTPYTSPLSLHNTRIAPAHPEGIIEAFANIYRNFASTLRCKLSGTTPTEADLDFPGIDDGVSGMEFLETVVVSSASEVKWTKIIH